MAATPQEIGRLWFEKVWNERDANAAREWMAADAIGDLENGTVVVGPEPFLEFQASFLQAMPDLHITIIGILSDEREVCVQWSAKGTHTGVGLGIAPSGAEMNFRGVTWFNIAGGKIVGGRDFWNQEGLMKSMVAATQAAVR